MTHCSTVSQAKAGSRPYRGPPTRNEPRSGTKIRALYDLFLANPGRPIEFHTANGNYSAVEYLRNSYGLDIRRVRNGVWLFAGEWHGKAYVDHVADREVDRAAKSD